MEYDFVVAPGADPNQIRLSFADDIRRGSAYVPALIGSAVLGKPVGDHRDNPTDNPTGDHAGSPLQIDDNGDLVLATGGGDVRMKKPIIYQEIAGVRVPVSGGYRLLSPPPAGEGRGGGNQGAPASSATPTVSFQIAAYDRTRPLIIDPILVYSTYLGGLGGGVEDDAHGIAVDATGAAYVTGYTYSTNFPTASPLQGANAGGVRCLCDEDCRV
jgi:hypothetical protein